MLWCQGGHFQTGSGSSPGQNGTSLCRRGDVVVVTINQRLNALGFLYLADIGGPEFAASGDTGMLDIVQALQWVRRNVGEFGGDPDNVTIFGQSGGGRKVGTLLAMPSAKGRFHHAIIESSATIKLIERDDASGYADRVLRELGLKKTRLRELQTMLLDRIMAAYSTVSRAVGPDQFSPTVDRKIVPQHPFHPNASAVSAGVPLMIGSTRTELTLALRNDARAFSLCDHV
jgi:para-nitrobenzyl esterase